MQERNGRSERKRKIAIHPQFQFEYDRKFIKFLKRLFFEDDLSPEEKNALLVFNSVTYENVLVELFRKLNHSERVTLIDKCPFLKDNVNIYYCEGLEQIHGWMYDIDGFFLNCAEEGCNAYLCWYHFNRKLKRGVTMKPENEESNWFCKTHFNRFRRNVFQEELVEVMENADDNMHSENLNRSLDENDQKSSISPQSKKCSLM